jgi:PKD repeat protein
MVTRSGYVTVYAPVTASFGATPTSGKPPLTVVFANQSSGDYTSVLWFFGDGITSTLQSPSHTYLISGSYTVSLTATGPGGTNAITRPNFITVGDSPSTYRLMLPIITKNTGGSGNSNVNRERSSLWRTIGEAFADILMNGTTG